jgi:uncharacterized protein
MQKTTLVIGASTNEERYSNMAMALLLNYKIPVFAIGNKKGVAHNITIENEQLQFEDVHTVTLYINPNLQEQFIDYILNLKPKRIIFNPGTENTKFAFIAAAKGIETIEACTLVMLKTNQY